MKRNTRQKFFTRLLALCLPVSLLLPLALTGCGGGENAALVYLLEDEPQTLDPQVADDDNARLVINALFEGLTRLDDNGQATPGVAVRWEANSDCTAYTFYLREDAHWSDGSPVTANDFLYGWQRALDPATNSSTCTPLFVIANGKAYHNGKVSADTLGLSAPDSHTLVVTLAYSDPDFPIKTAAAPFMPCSEAYFVTADGKYGKDSNHILGNGPFTMENRYSWEHGEYINLVRSSTYVGGTDVSPLSLTITIDDGETGGNSLALLANGTADAAALTGDQADAATEAGCAVTTVTDTTWGLCFNTRSDNMKSASTRRLFLQSLNRKALLSFLPKGSTAADDILPPSTVFDGSDYRTAAGSGFYLQPDSDAVSKADTEHPPTITVLCPDDDTSKRLANQMITDWNQSLGRYYNMEPLPIDELEERVVSGDYDVALVGIRADGEGPLAFLSLFASDSEDNIANLSSKTYDSLLDIPSGSSASDVLNACRQAEQYLNDNAIFYPIYYETRHYAAGPGVSDVIFLPYDQGIDFRTAKK